MLVKSLGSWILGFLLAIMVHSIFFSEPIPMIISLVLFGISLITLFFFRSPQVLKAIFFFIGVGFGLLWFSSSLHPEESTILDVFVDNQETVSVTGIIVSEPITNESYSEFIVHAKSMVVNEQLIGIDTQVLIKSDTFTSYNYHDEVMVTAKIEKPEAFITDTDRIFDYAAYLGKDDVYYIMPYAEASILGKGRGLVRSLYSFKHYFLRKIYRIIPEPESGLLVGILFGQKSALSEEYENQFRTVGLMHIVVLSGYNVALVIHLLLRILAFLPLKVRSLIAVLGIVIFALLVGGGPTVIRASIMAVFIVLADIVGAQYNIKRALVIAGVIMVMINPKILYFDISFQLSFLATYGLIAFSPWLEEKLSFLPKFFAARDSAVATLSAQIMVMPLILYKIGELSIVSPLVNVLVLFAVPISMLIGFATALVAFISSPFAMVVGFVATFLLRYQLWIVRVFSNIPLASVTAPPFHWIFLVLMYCGIFWWIRKITPAEENMV